MPLDTKQNSGKSKADDFGWTDWIEHKPGQELPIGTYGRFEFYGEYQQPAKSIKEGLVTQKQKGHGCWYAEDPYQPACMITRYQLRVDASLFLEIEETSVPARKKAEREAAQ